jgi:hypothetical protein
MAWLCQYRLSPMLSSEFNYQRMGIIWRAAFRMLWRGSGNAASCVCRS